MADLGRLPLRTLRFTKENLRWWGFPAGLVKAADGYEVLRLRICFASRSKFLAQDDNSFNVTFSSDENVYFWLTGFFIFIAGSPNRLNVLRTSGSVMASLP